MPTLAPPTTTEYRTTFHWTASSWEGMEGEDGEIDYDGQPNADSEPVVVSLPSGSTPWDVYNEADCFAEVPDTDGEAHGWDDDGMTIEFDGRCLFLSGCLINPEMTWDRFQSI